MKNKKPKGQTNKEYEITIYVQEVMFPEIGKVLIEAESRKKARQWVREHIYIE